MRPHKYRAWSKKWERWFLPEDIRVYGNGEVDCEYRGEPGRFGPGDHIGVAPREDVVLMEYSDIKDKGGKKICEGDIIKMCYGLARVYFDHGCFMVEFDTDTDLLWPYCCKGDDTVIVGNIKDNPELLEKTA